MLSLRTLSVAFAVLVPPGFAQEIRPPDAAKPGWQLERVWTLKGVWTGVVGDAGKGTIHALDSRGRCFQLDLKGEIRGKLELPKGAGSLLRIGKVSGEKILLTFGVWETGVRAHDLKGRLLWSHPRGSGIDDVWAADLDGDKSDEVVVGHNGFTGLHVLKGNGQLAWKSTAVGNVWHVCAGDVLGEGVPRVVTTAADGRVHIFSSDGEKEKVVDAGCYASMVRTVRLSEKDKAATILVTGSGLDDDDESVVITALAGDGTRKWMRKIAGRRPAHVDSACVAARGWWAVGVRGGHVHVVELASGATLASVSKQGVRPEVGWAKGEDGVELLLVATGLRLNAFRVTKVE